MDIYGAERMTHAEAETMFRLCSFVLALESASVIKK